MFARPIAVLLLGLLAACGKSSTSSPSTAAGPAPGGEANSAAVQDAAQLSSTLNDLTQAVRKYAAEQRRVPKTLEELVAGGYLSRLPAAPAGKKFNIDSKLQVYLENQ